MCCIFKGESNLKFLWFILAQSGSAVPSFSEVKKFKLPGLSLPTRVIEFDFPY